MRERRFFVSIEPQEGFPSNVRFGGSPSALSSVVERSVHIGEVAGSIPAGRTRILPASTSRGRSVSGCKIQCPAVCGAMIKMIKTIIFDVGGVITQYDWIRFYSNFAARVGISPDVVINYHHEGDTIIPSMLGEASFDDFLEYLKKHSSKGEKAEQRNIWLEEALKIVRVNKPLLDLIDKLHADYQLLILTNLTEGRMMVDEALNLYSHFDHTLLSCKEHLKKTDEKFYRLALSAAGVAPAEAVFVDDKKEHVVAAEALGIHGIVFSDVEKLQEDLQKLGVIIR